MTEHLILSIDCATGPCSAVVLHGDKPLAQLREPASSAQSRLLMPLIESALKEARIAYADLTDIVTTIGPGSFTGLRIGLAAARGIGLARGIPVHGISTLAAIAYADTLQHSQPVTAILPAGKGQVYAQRFTMPFAPGGEPCVLYPEQVDTFASGSRIVQSTPDALYAGLLFAHNIASVITDALPLYIREPDAVPQFI